MTATRKRRERAVVLAVEPDGAMRDQLVEWLLEAGYRAHGVGTFAAAREVLRAIRPDLLIAEVRLGAFNGVHLVIGAAGLHPRPPAIVTSGTEDAILAAEARRHGAAFIVKPIERQRFLDLVGEMLSVDAGEDGGTVPGR